MSSASAVPAKAEHNTFATVDPAVEQHATSYADAATFTLQSDATLLSTAGCCDQGYEILKAVEASCCDQGYQVSSMVTNTAGTTKVLLAVAFSAFLALLARRYQQRSTHTLQFRQ